MSTGEVLVGLVILAGFMSVCSGLLVLVLLIVADRQGRTRRRVRERQEPAPVYPIEFWRARRDRTRAQGWS